MEYSIPAIEQPERCEKRNFISSPFVELIDGNEISVKMQYPLLGMKNAEKKCLLRKEVRDLLLLAQKQLPTGLRFRIWDAWRPFALQEELFYFYAQIIIKEFQLADLPEELQKREISKYVALPVRDTICPPAHTTGGAIDLTLIDRDGNELNMGTAFDAFTQATHTDFYEETDEDIIKQNRRILYSAMTSVGFTNLPSEWWHYSTFTDF